MLCSAATKECRLTHGINPEYRKTCFGNQFSTFESPRDFPQRISSENVRRNREAIPHQSKGKASLTSEDGQNNGTIPMPTFASRPSIASSTIPVTATELCGQTAKTANAGITIRQIPHSRIILGVEDPIQNTGFKWF